MVIPGPFILYRKLVAIWGYLHAVNVVEKIDVKGRVKEMKLLANNRRNRRKVEQRIQGIRGESTTLGR